MADQADVLIADIGTRAPIRHHRRRKHRGQGLVELAFVMPIMLLMLLGTVDFARAFSAYIQVTNAAREGAYFAARSSDNAHNDGAIIAAAQADSGQIFGELPDVDPDVDTDADGYEQVIVTVSYTFEPLFDYPGIPAQIDMSRTVTMRVIGS